MTTLQPDLLKDNAFTDVIEALHPTTAQKFDHDKQPPQDLLEAVLGYLLKLIRDETKDKTRAAEAIQVLKSLAVFTVKIRWVPGDVEQDQYEAIARIELDTHCNDSKKQPLVFSVSPDTRLGIAVFKLLGVDLAKTSVRHKF